jgi:hypothetical protein
MQRMVLIVLSVEDDINDIAQFGSEDQILYNAQANL